MVVFLKRNLNANTQPPLAFGSRAPRFGEKKMDTQEKPKDLKSDVGCDPCHYQPTPMSKVYGVGKNTAKKDSWRYKFELEEWSKNLGYRNTLILGERRFRATCGGPATCDIQEINTHFSRKNNTGFGTAPRFKTVKFVTPAPGTYYKRTPFKAPHGPHSSVPTLYYGEPRFRFKVVPWSLAPNRYTIVDKDSIEMKSKKLVSLRGPYDLFTGPRDNTTITSHFGSKHEHCPSWPMALPDSFEWLKKSHFGEMNKTGREARYSGRKPVIQAQLNLNPLAVFKQNKVPFLSSDDRPRGLKLPSLSYPSVGRYDIQPCMHTNVPGNGHKHVFLSKVPRTSGSYIKPPLNSF